MTDRCISVWFGLVENLTMIRVILPTNEKSDSLNRNQPIRRDLSLGPKELVQGRAPFNEAYQPQFFSEISTLYGTKLGLHVYMYKNGHPKLQTVITTQLRIIIHNS